MAFSLGGGSTEETRLLWRLAGMGFQFGTEIIAGVLLGWLVDRTFGTTPWGVVIGAVAGILVAMSHFIRQAVRLNREMDRAAPLKRPAKPHTAAPIRSEDAEGDWPLLSDEEEELTHDQWKALRDRELEPDSPSTKRDDEG